MYRNLFIQVVHVLDFDKVLRLYSKNTSNVLWNDWVITTIFGISVNFFIKTDKFVFGSSLLYCEVYPSSSLRTMSAALRFNALTDDVIIAIAINRRFSTPVLPFPLSADIVSYLNYSLFPLFLRWVSSSDKSLRIIGNSS